MKSIQLLVGLSQLGGHVDHVAHICMADHTGHQSGQLDRDAHNNETFFSDKSTHFLLIYFNHYKIYLFP